MVITGSKDSTIKIWAPEKGGSGNVPRYAFVQHLKEGHSEQVRLISITPDGERFVTSSDDKKLIVWVRNERQGDAQPSYHRFQELKGHGEHIPCVAMTPDGETIVSGSRNRELIIWVRGSTKKGDQSLYEILQVFKDSHNDTVEKVSLTADGRIIATGSSESSSKRIKGNKNLSTPAFRSFEATQAQ